MEHRKTPVVTSLYTSQYLSVINYDQRFKREYARETLWEVPRLLSENLDVAEDLVERRDTVRLTLFPTRASRHVQPSESQNSWQSSIAKVQVSIFKNSCILILILMTTQKRLIRVRIYLVFLVYNS